MSDAASTFEGLLHQALSPVEPPEDLGRRLEGALTSITEIAAEELEAWELSAMRDPRNWARPVAAAVLGGTAGAALVVLRARHRHRPPSTVLQHARANTERAVDELGGQARRLFKAR